MARKRIIIVANTAKDGVAEKVEALREWFDRRAEVLAVLDTGQPVPPEAKSADLCVVFGGDGTLLGAARAFAGVQVPLLGVNMGKLGFMAEFNVEHMQKHLDAILSGQVQPTERMMLDVCIFGSPLGAAVDKKCPADRFTSPVANDVAISAGEPFRMIDLLVTQDDQQIARYLGDGLVVSTPTGSTGYNMSAGGPVLEPTLDAMAITPVAAHTLSLRSIVVRSDRPIHITATRVNPGTTASIDGQVRVRLCDKDVVEVRRAPRGALIVPHPGRRFFRTLAEKLQWGQSPHHP